MSNERKEDMREAGIIIGLITNADFINAIRPYWIPDYIGDPALRAIANWSLEFYDKHEEVVSHNIEMVFERKRKKMDKDLAEEIEELVLPQLSIEYNDKPKSLRYLLHEAEKYFKIRSVEIFRETTEALILKEQLKELQEYTDSYEFFSGFKVEEQDVHYENPDELDREIEQAYADALEPIIKYKGALGKLLNEHLIKGGFVGILAPEKRFKSWIILDMAMTSVAQGVPVAFFQAGDMTKSQQTLRIVSHITKTPTKEPDKDYLYVPVVDCIKNQRGECDEPERACRIGITNRQESELRGSGKLTKREIIEAMETFPEYKPCMNCTAFTHNPWGAIFLKKIQTGRTLPLRQAKLKARKFFAGTPLFRMKTYFSGTLTIKEMKVQLKNWKKENFEPKVIIVDYADLLEDYTQKEPRHKANKIWRDLRSLSQEQDALVIAPTQADADSYEIATLKLKNFSEDKRKYSHVTAMFGLNLDKDGIEKALGVLRINKLLVREGINENEQVHVTQRLDIGRPLVHSFF